MKSLVLGLGQDSVLLAKHFDTIGIDYRILARRSSGSIVKSENLELSKHKISFVSEINEIEMLRLKQVFDFTHIYNFAANSFVQDSRLNFEYFINNNSKILWEIFKLDYNIPGLWVFHPLSSEILDPNIPITENTCGLTPRNAYGAAKALDYHACAIANKERNLSINYSILFNHESKFRPDQFFTKKVIKAFQTGTMKNPYNLNIYNTQSKRDWGSAPEFMELIAKAARNNISGQSILGTGHLMSVEEFIDYCFQMQNIDFEKIQENGLIKWSSNSLNIIEVGRDHLDANRKICAPKDVVRSKFGNTPSVYGKKLIRGLMNGDI